MMRLLLDTHVVLWSQASPERLSREARTALDDGGNELWISPLSVWEIALAMEKRQVELDSSLPHWLERFAARRGPYEAPLTTAVALAAGRMHFEHGDPFDRLLAATALIEKLTLLTADSQLLARTDIRLMRAAG